MRAGREIGERQLVARQPIAVIRQPRDIGHVVAEIGVGGAQHVGLGRGMRGALEHRHDVRLEQRRRHLAMQLAMEPIDKAAHLGLLERPAREERRMQRPRRQPFRAIAVRRHNRMRHRQIFGDGV